MVGPALVPRLGGLGFIAFVPMLVVGSILFGKIGISSQSAGADALRRIEDAGAFFPVMNALFHLGALLVLPGAIALVVMLGGGQRDGILWLGSAFLILALAVGAGLVFSLNHGLFGIAAGFHAAAPDQQDVLAATADMNLHTQAGAELVQSVCLGLWVLCVSAAIGSTDWPSWILYLGLAGGVGFILAGLSSVLFQVPGVGMALGALGALGLLLFAVWIVAVGIRLWTIPIA